MSFNALQAKTWRFNSIGDTDVLTLETLPVALPAAGSVSNPDENDRTQPG